MNCERPYERLLCEFACLVSYFYGRVSAVSEIRGLFSDAVCVNALLFRRVHKVEPKNHLFLSGKMTWKLSPSFQRCGL